MRLNIEHLPLRSWDDRPLDQLLLSSLPVHSIEFVTCNLRPVDKHAADRISGNLFGSCKHPFHPQRVSGWMKYALKYFEEGNKKAHLVPWLMLAERLSWNDDDIVFFVFGDSSVYVTLWTWLQHHWQLCDVWLDCVVIANNESQATVVFWEGSGPIVVERRCGSLHL